MQQSPRSEALRTGRARVRAMSYVALGLLGLSAGVTGCSAASSSTVSLPACRTDQLDLVRGQSDNASTHVAVELAFHNHSSQPCTLDGYPQVRFYDAQGHVVPIDPQQVTSAYMFNTQRVQVVRLPAGAAAYFKLQWDDASASGRGCVSATSADITPPGQTQALSLSLQVTSCDGNLIISPVEQAAF